MPVKTPTYASRVYDLLKNGEWVTSTTLRKVTHTFSQIIADLREQGYFVESRPTSRTTKAGGVIHEYRITGGGLGSTLSTYVRMPFSRDRFMEAVKQDARDTFGKITTKEAREYIGRFAAMNDDALRAALRQTLASDLTSKTIYADMVDNIVN